MKFTDHIDHEWVEVRPCVYCKPCGVRLYQGRLPKDKAATARAMDEIVEKAAAKAEQRDREEWAARTPEEERVYAEGFAAYRDGVHMMERLDLNPYTATRVSREVFDRGLMRWWDWGWNDAEFGHGARRAKTETPRG